MIKKIVLYLYKQKLKIMKDLQNQLIDLIRFYQQAQGGNTKELRQVYSLGDLEELEEYINEYL